MNNARDQRALGGGFLSFKYSFQWNQFSLEPSFPFLFAIQCDNERPDPGVSYYESESEYPPTSLLAGLATVLGRSIEEVLATTPVKAQAKGKASDTRLHRRLQQIEKLEPTEKRQIMQLIDAFIERGQLKRHAQRAKA